MAELVRLGWPVLYHTRPMAAIDTGVRAMKTVNEAFVQLGMLCHEFQTSKTPDARTAARDRIVSAIAQDRADARAEVLRAFVDECVDEPPEDPPRCGWCKVDLDEPCKSLCVRARAEALLAGESERTEPTSEQVRDAIAAWMTRCTCRRGRCSGWHPDDCLSNVNDNLAETLKVITIAELLAEPGAAADGSTGDQP